MTAPATAGVPLTAAQLALWTEEQTADAASNSGYLAVAFTGPLDERHVRTAALAVLHRHEPLRSVMRATPAGVRLLVLPAAQALSFRRDTLPLPDAPGGPRRAVRSWWERTEQTRGWDLATDGPIRFALLDHGRDRATLVMSLHHAGFDGRSKFLVARDLTAALRAARSGTAPPLSAPLARPAAAVPDPATTAAARSHWTRVLPACAEPLLLPGTTAPSGGGVRCSDQVLIARPDVEALRALAARHRATTFTALVAALGLQLAAYGNRHVPLAVAADVSVPETRDVAGAQINVVPTDLPLDPAATGDDLMAEAAAAVARLRTRRHIPFPDLTRALADPCARPALTQLGLSFPRAPRDLDLDIPGLTADWDFVSPNTASTFERTLQIRADWPDCTVRLDHRTENTGPEQATAFIDHFRRALHRLAHHPAARAGDFVLPAARVRGPARPAGPQDAASSTAAALPAAPGPAGPTWWQGPPDAAQPVEAALARLRGTAFTTGGPPPDGAPVRRLCAPLAAAGTASRAAPGVRELVVPFDQLRLTAALARWAGDGRVLGAHWIDDGTVHGWAALPGADPVRPPLLTPAPGRTATVHGPDGRALPAGVPGRIAVTTGPGTAAPALTGHLGRITPDGRLEYLGRDGQRWLRHRGFIDVPLVERVLAACPGVDAARVEARATPRGTVAVAVAVTALPAAALRAHLREHIGGHTLPGRIDTVRAPGDNP